MVLLVERSHGGGGGRDDVVDEEEECVLRAERDALTDQEVELPNSQVGGNLKQGEDDKGCRRDFQGKSLAYFFLL